MTYYFKYDIFNNCRSLKEIDLVNCSNIPQAYRVFQDCVDLIRKPTWDFSSVTRMGDMFKGTKWA